MAKKKGTKHAARFAIDAKRTYTYRNRVKPEPHIKSKLTEKQRMDFLYEAEVAVKTHDVSRLDTLLEICAGVCNGNAIAKRLRESLG